MPRRFLRTGFALLALAFASVATAAPIPVKVVQSDGKFQLLRDGKPYFIKGGGGDGSKTILVECGGNSFRTWGVGNDTQAKIDEAEKLGLTVTVGFWIEPKFNWNDAKAVQKQLDGIKKNVLKYKDSPAVLCWALGNEMENGGKESPELWKAIDDLAKMCHQVDPNHPTMSVIAEIGGKKLEHIKEFCPDLDIVGINTYGGGTSIGERYKKANVGKPYVITEFGPAGTWEIGRNSFGAPQELTSQEKAKAYRDTYEKSVTGEPGLCLGSYAFTWGFKREATATWYGLFLPDGSKLAGVDTLAELWSGKSPAVLCPTITPIKIAGADQPNPGETLTASIETTDPQNAKLDIEWSLVREMSNYNVTGTGEKATADFSKGIVKNGLPQVTVKLPTDPGLYRIYCYVRTPNKTAAVASTPIRIKDAAK